MYILKNDRGITKQVKKGFSWTALFFGIFVPLTRGDWKWFLLSIVADMVTFGLFWLVFPFIYNKIYLNGLLNKGYRIV